MPELDTNGPASNPAEAGTNHNENVAYNKWILIGAPLLGLLITLSAFWVGPAIRLVGLDRANGDIQALLESIGTNIGTAVLAFVFFYVAEKKLVHAVTSAQQAALRSTKQDLDAARADITDLRFGRLNRRAEVMREFSGDKLDQNSYFAFLKQALEDRAIGAQGISVPASKKPGSFVLNFSISEPGSVLLTLIWGWGGASCSAQWGPHDRWADVINRLDVEAENWSKTETFDWELAIKRLPSAVRLADESVFSNADGLLTGRPHEFVGSDWALTTVGLERLSGQEGTMSFDAVTTKRGGLFRRTEEPPRPEGVEEQEWKYLLHIFDEALEHRELMSD